MLLVYNVEPVMFNNVSCGAQSPLIDPRRSVNVDKLLSNVSEARAFVSNSAFLVGDPDSMDPDVLEETNGKWLTEVKTFGKTDE